MPTNLTAPLFPAIKDSVLQKKNLIKEEEQEDIIEDTEMEKTVTGSEDPMLSSDDDMPPEGHRIKILNLDWSKVRAYHLYFMLSFRVPKGGEVLSVAIYSSDVEAAKAPTESIHSDNLRCYFAVVECNSCATADYIYETCDGMKIKMTPDVLDLYLIPDSVKFEHPPHDVVTKGAKIMDYMNPPQEIEVKPYYGNGNESQSDSLVLKLKLNLDKLDGLDLDEYFASDDDDDHVVEDGVIPGARMDKYDALLQFDDGRNDGRNDDKDIEVTMSTDLKGRTKYIIGKNKNAWNDLIWDKYVEGRKGIEVPARDHL